MTTVTFYLQQNVSGAVQVLTGTWVRLTNNSDASTYVSTAASDSNGLITVNTVPAGSYTVATGPTNVGAWTNTGDNNFTVEATDSANLTTIPANITIAGDVSITKAPGKINMTGTGQAKIVGGTTGIVIRDNSDANSLASSDNTGLWTFRSGVLVPYTTGTTLAPNSAYATVPVKIDDQLLVGTASIITFAPNPLPTTFRHLVVEWYARGDAAAVNIAIGLRFNNDSAANYDFQNSLTSAATVLTTTETLGAGSISVGFIPAANDTANYFGSGRAEVVHYQSTTGNKQAFSQMAWGETNLTGAAGRMGISGGKWRTTATAITRVDLVPATGNFTAGSLFTLWGIP